VGQSAHPSVNSQWPRYKLASLCHARYREHCSPALWRSFSASAAHTLIYPAACQDTFPSMPAPMRSCERLTSSGRRSEASRHLAAMMGSSLSCVPQIFRNFSSTCLKSWRLFMSSSLYGYARLSAHETRYCLLRCAFCGNCLRRLNSA
jgi:hypothetical protein